MLRLSKMHAHTSNLLLIARPERAEEGIQLDWKSRSEANLLPLSIEQRWLARALLEWLYNGEMYDLEYPCETCELCEHPDLRYQFKL
jgi:hypothetical protein